MVDWPSVQRVDTGQNEVNESCTLQQSQYCGQPLSHCLQVGYCAFVHIICIMVHTMFGGWPNG